MNIGLIRWTKAGLNMATMLLRGCAKRHRFVIICSNSFFVIICKCSLLVVTLPPSGHNSVGEDQMSWSELAGGSRCPLCQKLLKKYGFILWYLPDKTNLPSCLTAKAPETGNHCFIQHLDPQPSFMVPSINVLYPTTFTLSRRHINTPTSMFHSLHYAVSGQVHTTHAGPHLTQTH